MRHDYIDDIASCPVANVQKIIRGKWTMVIVYFLSQNQVLRFSELKRKIPQVTEANLTKELRTLESFGLIHREVYREVPPKVEYSLTAIGRKIIPVLEALEKWALEYEDALIVDGNITGSSKQHENLC